MNKLIVVEGMDNTGKDTQIKKIVEHYHAQVFHTLHYHAVKARDPMQARFLAQKTYREMFEICKSTLEFTNVILNRSHYGEYVYGHIYRNYPDPEYVFDMERDFFQRYTAFVNSAL